MHQAEDMLMATGAVCPIYYYNDLFMQKAAVEGVHSNPYGFKYSSMRPMGTPTR